MDLAGVVMAAGEGRRMRSRIPKPLHPICGKEMISYPVELLRNAGADRVVVVVSDENREAIEAVLGDDVEYAVQPERNGTAGAIACCAAVLKGTADTLLVIGADTPLVTGNSARQLVAQQSANAAQMTVLTAPGGANSDLGRVIESDGRISQIVEAVDCQGSSCELAANFNAGVYCFNADWLWQALEKVAPAPTGELYLTQLAAIASQEGAEVLAVRADAAEEAWGVNDRLQLSQAEDVLRRRIREHWMQAGVTMPDPGSVYIDAGVSLGMDTVILPNTMLTGRTAVGENCEIGPNSVIRDSVIGNNCRVTSSALEQATMEDDTDVGPFSHLRPGAYLESGVHIGNYVEVKESHFKAGAVMGHFGYAGDATIGARVNVGAGMITCNYDGRDKHRTVVEDDAFIGCDTMLVAPVTVGEGSITGAGAVVTKDVPPARLAVGVPATIKRSLK